MLTRSSVVLDRVKGVTRHLWADEATRLVESAPGRFQLLSAPGRPLLTPGPDVSDHRPTYAMDGHRFPTDWAPHEYRAPLKVRRTRRQRRRQAFGN